MEKINEFDYKGFKTEFFLTPKVKTFLDDWNVGYEEVLDDKYHWYEVFLFEQLDENQSGEPDKKFGNNFKAVFYGIIEKADKYIGQKSEGFEEEFNCDDKKLISDRISIVSEQFNKHKSFAIKYKVFMS